MKKKIRRQKVNAFMLNFTCFRNLYEQTSTYEQSKTDVAPGKATEFHVLEIPTFFDVSARYSKIYRGRNSS